MRGFNFNISSLFSGFGSGNAFSSFNFSDYASIKNGSYALRVQRMAEAVEEQLKHARSKEEADRIISSSLTGISKNDPDREFIYAAVNRISTEFHKSGAYEKLPNTMEEANKKNSKESGDVFSDAEDEADSDNDEFDLKNWSPLTEVYDALPKFVANA